MTFFRLNGSFWSLPSPSNHDSRRDGGDNEKNQRSKSRSRKKSVKDDSPKLEKRKLGTPKKGRVCDPFLQVDLTTNALLHMVHGAFITTSLYNGDTDKKVDEDGEGIVVSTRASVAGPFVLHLFRLQRQQYHHHQQQNGSNEKDGDDNANRKKNPCMFVASISDGTKTCSGTILQKSDGDLDKLSECIVSVSGFIMGLLSSSLESDNDSGDERDNIVPKDPRSTSKNETNQSPFIFITQYELLYKKRSDTRTDHQEVDAVEKEQIQTGNGKTPSMSENLNFKVGTYQNRGRLASLISSTRLRIDDFINNFEGGTSGHEADEALRKNSLEVSNFMEQDSAIMALTKRKEKASLLSSSSFSLMLGSMKDFQNYTSVIKGFEQRQIEEQFTSLTDMKAEFCADDFVNGEESADNIAECGKDQSWMQHKETLEYALQCKDETLSPELLFRWHAWLLGDGLEQEAGSFRSDNVSNRVGEFCDAMEKHWLPNIRKEPTNPTQIACFAAAAMLGVLDLVPFRVGNQRLARIILNWTLRRAGLPFCVTLYSNREEKLEFISVVQKTRQNLCLVPQGHVDESETAVILRSTGGLRPLVGYLLLRLAKATTDLYMLVEQKSRTAAEEMDARLVRLAREKAVAEGTCIICFENRPNIATLCCGKPIHLNCLAQWLKSNSSCPQCRADLPSLSVGEETCQRVNDRRFVYGRERISERGFTSDDFFFQSSSSSSELFQSSEDSSISSSSSSSSESSPYFYSGLDYDVNGIRNVDEDESIRSVRSLLRSRSDTPIPIQNQSLSNYVTSDEEQDYHSDSANGDASSRDTYQSDSDDERYSFRTNDSQERSETYDETANFELARYDETVIVDDTQSTGETETSEERYDLLNAEDSSSDDGDSSYTENDLSPRFNDFSSPNANFAPFRVSFLDPELLGWVQDGESSRTERPSRRHNINIVDVRGSSRIDPGADGVHPFNTVRNSCDFPLRRRVSPFDQGSRLS